jgi:hypothetical protein
MLGICVMVGLLIAGQAQTPEKDVKTRPWTVIAKQHATAAKVYPTAEPAHPFAMLPAMMAVSFREIHSQLFHREA